MDLFRHYLKVAFRNLRKYKSQTFISTIGLVAGFTCFALSAVWIRYEMTFDNFQKDYDRIHLIEHESLTDERRIGYDLKFPVPFADYLEKEFPELAIGRIRLLGKGSKYLMEIRVEYRPGSGALGECCERLRERIMEQLNTKFQIDNIKRIDIRLERLAADAN